MKKTSAKLSIAVELTLWAVVVGATALLANGLLGVPLFLTVAMAVVPLLLNVIALAIPDRWLTAALVMARAGLSRVRLAFALFFAGDLNDAKRAFGRHARVLVRCRWALDRHDFDQGTKGGRRLLRPERELKRRGWQPAR